MDVADNTRANYVAHIGLLAPLRKHRLADMQAADIADWIASTSAGTSTSDGKPRKRETIRKARQTLAMILDYAQVAPNPARDKQRTRLPREDRVEPNPPAAADIEAVFRLLSPKHRLALLWLDWSGTYVGSIDTLRVGDYDESRRRVRRPARTTKQRRAIWIDLPDVIADALEAKLGPREDRDLDAKLCAPSGSDALRTAMGKACKALGIPVFSPHDLRHRRISLLHLRGMPWARIGELVGQTDLKTTANTYTHGMVDETEVDYAALLN